MKTDAGRIAHVAAGLSRMIASEGLGKTVRYVGHRARSRLASVPAATEVIQPAESPALGERLVSIVLPVYNHADFLPEAVRAVLAQTYHNWELIIVNDGSTDDFEGAIAPFRSDRRIKVLEQQNLKLPAALNNGFRHAAGDYFTWTSADNVMLPNQIEILVRALDTHPDCGLAYSDYVAIDDRGEPLRDPDWRRHNRPDGTARLHLPARVTISNFHDRGDNFLGASFLWRASVHEVVGAHDESTFGGEDYDFWLRMHLVTEFLHVPESLYEYRVHDNTLNARAVELRLFDNVRRLLDQDKERRSVLLARQNRLRCPRDAHWRDPAQYAPTLQQRLRVSRYSDPSREQTAEAGVVHVLLVDVPLARIEKTRLAGADVIVADNPMTCHWLKQQGLPLTIRIIQGPLDENAAVVRHAAALALYEKDKARTGYVLTRNIPATLTLRPAPQRLLLLTSTWGEGGLEQVVLDIAEGARASGISVTIGCTDCEPSQALQASCARLGITAVGFSKSAIAVSDYIRKNRIDVVNYHHASLGAQLLANMEIPTIYTVHNSYIWKTAAELNTLAAQLEPMSAFVAVSRQAAAYANRWLKAPAHKIIIIPNGINIPDIEQPDAAADNQFTFNCTATLNPIKCQRHLVNAFAEVHRIFGETRLKLVGFAPDRDYLRTLRGQIEKLGLKDRVEVISGVEREAALRLMAQSDCMVLPSLIEGWSIAAAEAMLLGVPVIVSDVGSAYDMKAITPSVRVVPGKVDNILELTGDGLYRALQEEDELYEKRLSLEMVGMVANRTAMRRHAREAIPEAQKLFSMERAMQSYLELLRRV